MQLCPELRCSEALKRQQLLSAMQGRARAGQSSRVATPQATNGLRCGARHATQACKGHQGMPCLGWVCVDPAACWPSLLGTVLGTGRFFLAVLMLVARSHKSHPRAIKDRPLYSVHVRAVQGDRDSVIVVSNSVRVKLVCPPPEQSLQAASAFSAPVGFPPNEVLMVDGVCVLQNRSNKQTEQPRQCFEDAIQFKEYTLQVSC